MQNEFPDVFHVVERSGDGKSCISITCALYLIYFIEMVRATELSPGPDPDGRVRSIKAWLKSKGVRDFEPVSLFCDQLAKVCHSSLHGGRLGPEMGYTGNRD